jgi:hypothetical protein
MSNASNIYAEKIFYERNDWANNERGILKIYNNKLYYFNMHSEFFTSNTTAQLTT